MQKRIILTIATALFMSHAAFAGTNDPKIQQREQNQERRIEQGIQNGALTPKETGRLEAEQAKIKQDEVRMKSDGKLTAKERKKLRREQNRANRDISHLKHNGRRAAL